MWAEFQCRVPGKWVLCGEHAVLRGATAVALPHPEFGLDLRFVPGGDELRVETTEGAGAVRELLDAVWEGYGDGRARPRGTLSFASTIPVGSGLGSSAAVCVALTRWLAEPLRLAPGAQFEFARELENRFHGQSSGMDIAAVMSGGPIAYTQGREPQRLAVTKLPRFTFHDTGLRARTSECIFRVNRKRDEAPVLAVETDELMRQAAGACIEGLTLYADAPDLALRRLQLGMDQAFEAFLRWELVPAEAMHLRDKLLKDGARAVRLTGAGGGGFLVALHE